MKRQLNFDFENDKYVIKEDNTVLFEIDGQQLKFVSLDFYNGVYKNQSANIELNNIIVNDPFRKGMYIFNWLKEMIVSIQEELNDPDIDELEEITDKLIKRIPLFELSACAGDGFYTEGPVDVQDSVNCPYNSADFAVNISGKSMEPTIKDGSVVFVQNIKSLSDGDIGIFVVDGHVMCKRYRENEIEKWLEPDNKSNEFKDIYINENTSCIIQGKVLMN